jgi:chaperonin cofactor prefoldin
MNTFIEKNMLLDGILELNEYILTYDNSSYIIHLLETINVLRENLNTNEDTNLLNKIYNNIGNIIFECEESKKLFEYEENYEIENLNLIIYKLEISRIDISKFIYKINNIDTLADIFEEISL